MSGTPALVDPFPIADADIRSRKWGKADVSFCLPYRCGAGSMTEPLSRIAFREFVYFGFRSVV